MRGIGGDCLFVSFCMKEINKLFKRIERYMTRISDADILNFDNYRKEDMVDLIPGSPNKS